MWPQLQTKGSPSSLWTQLQHHFAAFLQPSHLHTDLGRTMLSVPVVTSPLTMDPTVDSEVALQPSSNPTLTKSLRQSIVPRDLRKDLLRDPRCVAPPAPGVVASGSRRPAAPLGLPRRCRLLVASTRAGPETEHVCKRSTAPAAAGAELGCVRLSPFTSRPQERSAGAAPPSPAERGALAAAGPAAAHRSPLLATRKRTQPPAATTVDSLYGRESWESRPSEGFPNPKGSSPRRHSGGPRFTLLPLAGDAVIVARGQGSTMPPKGQRGGEAGTETSI
ncbi:uncharacterized protein [Macaca fascicularis]|uniref:uncharacterized protein n=1 Tax=Macaca fascicularis TaxID=9541 RepID=UPI003D1538C9